MSLPKPRKLRFPADTQFATLATGRTATAPYGGIVAGADLNAEDFPVDFLNPTVPQDYGVFENYSGPALYTCKIQEESSTPVGFFNYYPPIWRVVEWGRVLGDTQQSSLVAANSFVYESNGGGSEPPQHEGGHVWQKQQRVAQFMCLHPSMVQFIPPDVWSGDVHYSVEVTITPVSWEVYYMSQMAPSIADLWTPMGNIAYEQQLRWIAPIAAGATFPAQPQSFHPLGAGIEMTYNGTISTGPPWDTALQYGRSGNGWRPRSLMLIKITDTDDLTLNYFRSPALNNTGTPATNFQDTENFPSGQDVITLDAQGDPIFPGIPFTLTNNGGSPSDYVVAVWSTGEPGGGGP